MGNSPVFDSIYRDYLDQVSRIDFHRLTDRLALQLVDDELIVPLFGQSYTVSAKGIIDPDGQRPSHSVSVVLCKYLLMAPENEPTEADWVTYKDFRDAGPFAGGFRSNAEQNISRSFSGRLAELGKACLQLDAHPCHENFPGQLAMRFRALPRIPIVLLFNDQDEEFPAQCSLLFERRAAKYLDMECLAISGWILAEWLKVRL
jgi:hypothetical protein